jgi:hypothetical protein
MPVGYTTKRTLVTRQSDGRVLILVEHVAHDGQVLNVEVRELPAETKLSPAPLVIDET